MITELIYDEKTHTFETVRYMPVAVKPYGSEGCLPIDKRTCPIATDTGIDSCVSAGGSSMCCGYMGHISINIIRCVEGRAP
jgi:hypothetical protein